MMLLGLTHRCPSHARTDPSLSEPTLRDRLAWIVFWNSRMKSYMCVNIGVSNIPKFPQKNIRVGVHYRALFNLDVYVVICAW